jgi:tRNA (cytidine/uridine-2'-O-)-methyltransferase
MKAAALDLRPHRLRIALIHPQIAPNTGNIGRLCVATGAELHLVRPLGFVLANKELRRSAMDYWPRLKLTVHDDDDAFWHAVGKTRFWLFSTKAQRPLWDARFQPEDWLIFGSETAGLSEHLLALHPSRALRIPQAADERCLNLSSAAAVGLYEALRQLTRSSAANAKP